MTGPGGPTTVHPLRRTMTAKAASRLVGTTVQPVRDPIAASPEQAGQVTRLVDADTGETVGLVTRLPLATLLRVRAAVREVKVYETGVGRAGKAPGQSVVPQTAGRTFGYAPRKAYARFEACRATSLTRDQPAQAQVLADLAVKLAADFRHLMPARADADEQVVRQVRDDWVLGGDSLWTSGVINRTVQLPYHRDGSNCHTWSAMPVLRYGMNGGQLHLPEYGIQFQCRDGDVVWFCGRELVHGVTPFTPSRPEAYRFTIVYYALAGMVDCQTYALETREGQVRRTARERSIAERLRNE